MVEDTLGFAVPILTASRLSLRATRHKLHADSTNPDESSEPHDPTNLLHWRTADLAELYGVETKRLNEQARRNAKRFPLDFVFQLSSDEYDVLRSHSATSSWGGRRYPPYAFTEHGALMAANMLASERAVEMGVLIVRAFVALRRALAGHEELARKLDELEARYDVQFRAVFDAIRQLMTPPHAARHPIGFTAPENSTPVL